MNRIASVASLAFLVSCAGHFPVQPYGKDTYVVYVDSFSGAKAHRAAVNTANEYCSALDLVMTPDAENTETSYDPWVGSRKDIQFIFRCLDENDPRLRPPEMRPTQRLLVEDE